MAAKEDQVIKLKNDIKNGNIGNLYLFFGDEQFLCELYKDRIINAIDDGGMEEFNRITVSGEKPNMADIDDAIESFPMMAERKTVFLRATGIFKKVNEDEKEYWTKRLSDIPEYVTVVFIEREVDKRSAVYKAAQKNGTVIEFGYRKDSELATMVQSELDKTGRKIRKEDAEYLVAVIDKGITNLMHEIDKLAGYCDQTVSRDDIDAVVSKSLEVRIFELTDGIMQKDAQKAISVLDDLETNKESPYAILALLNSAFDKMLRTKLLTADGMSYPEIASELAIAPFLVTKYANGAKAFSESFLTSAVMRGAEIDFEIKEGRVNDRDALRRYILGTLAQ